MIPLFSNYVPPCSVKTSRFHIFHSRISITRALKFGVVGAAVQFPVGKVARIVSQLSIRICVSAFDQNYQNNAVLCLPPYQYDHQYHRCAIICTLSNTLSPLYQHHHHCCCQQSINLSKILFSLQFLFIIKHAF